MTDRQTFPIDRDYLNSAGGIISMHLGEPCRLEKYLRSLSFG